MLEREVVGTCGRRLHLDDQLELVQILGREQLLEVIARHARLVDLDRALLDR
jgi:hypothetical protein